MLLFTDKDRSSPAEDHRLRRLSDIRRCYLFELVAVFL